MPRVDVPALHKALADMGAERFARAFGVRGRFRPERLGVRVPCPVHNGKDPNMSVHARDGKIMATCHSGCGGRSWDGLGLIAEVRGLNPQEQFAELCETAAQIAGTPLSALEQYEPEIHEPTPEERENERKKWIARCGLLGAFLSAFDLSGPAIPWLAQRRLSRRARGLHEAVSMGVVYLDPERVPEALDDLRERFGEEQLREHGILHDEFHQQARAGEYRFDRHRLAFPMRSPRGRVLSFQAHRMGSDHPVKLLGCYGRMGLYNADELRQRPGADVLLCEGPTDTLAVRVWRDVVERDMGCEVVPVGRGGTGRLRPELARWMRGRHVWVAYDGDAAGERGARDVADGLLDAGAERVHRLEVPPGLDVNDWIQALMTERRRSA